MEWSANPDSNWVRRGLQPRASEHFGIWHMEWSERRESNPHGTAWKADDRPLAHTRRVVVVGDERFELSASASRTPRSDQAELVSDGGVPGWIQTNDPKVMSPLLCSLSYWDKAEA